VYSSEVRRPTESAPTLKSLDSTSSDPVVGITTSSTRATVMVSSTPSTVMSIFAPSVRAVPIALRARSSVKYSFVPSAISVVVRSSTVPDRVSIRPSA